MAEQAQALDATAEKDVIEASANKEPTLENSTEKYKDLLAMCKSKLLILKAQNQYCRLMATKKAGTTELEPHGSVADLNDAVTQVKLHESAWERAKESYVFHQYTSSTETLNSDEEYIQAKLMDAYLEHNNLVETLHMLINRRNDKIKRAFEKKITVKQEIHNFKQMLLDQKVDLEKKAQENTAERTRTEDQIIRKLEQLNLSRILVGNILASSCIDFIKKPKWADVLMKCRKPVTMDNLNVYSISF